MKIKIPNEMALPLIGTFLKNLDENINNPEEISIDFSELSYSFPFSTLVIGSGLKQFVEARKKNNLSTRAVGIKQRNVISYLSHVGFFDFITLPIGNQMGQASGSSYTSITPLSKSSLLNKVSPPYIQLRHVILEESKKLSRVFSTKHTSENAINSISYAIREIIRNVFEHSRSDICYLFGQRWYDGSVEIGIIDEGVGIKESLSSSHNISLDKEAIELAIQPGITRIIDLESNNKHDNSGFGLYVLSRLGSEFGWFSIGSGNCHLSLQNNKEHVEYTNFPGTYVGLHLEKEPLNFEEKLETIIHDGEVEAHTMGREVKASSTSRIAF